MDLCWVVTSDTLSLLEGELSSIFRSGAGRFNQATQRLISQQYKLTNQKLYPLEKRRVEFFLDISNQLDAKMILEIIFLVN